MARPTASLLAVPLLLALACCGNPGPEPAADEPEPKVEARGARTDRAAEAPPAPRVVLARLPDSEEGNAAAAAGTLEVDGRCLYLRADDSTRYLIASTLPGARWDEERRALVVPAAGAGGAATTVRAGDEIVLGGSEASASALAEHWVEPPPDGCDGRRVWITHALAPAVGDGGG